MSKRKAPKKKDDEPVNAGSLVVFDGVTGEQETIDVEVLEPQGYGELNDPHTDGTPAEDFRGRVDDVKLDDINPEWVMRRLVKEATDFGTRTRQSSRIKALELIGNSMGMFDVGEKDDEDPKLKEAKRLSPEERRARIVELAKKHGLVPDGVKH